MTVKSQIFEPIANYLFQAKMEIPEQSVKSVQS